MTSATACPQRGSASRRPLSRVMIISKLPAIMNRHTSETSGAISPTCHFNGSQLVDQPTTTSA